MADWTLQIPASKFSGAIMSMDRIYTTAVIAAFPMGRRTSFLVSVWRNSTLHARNGRSEFKSFQSTPITNLRAAPTGFESQTTACTVFQGEWDP